MNAKTRNQLIIMILLIVVIPIIVVVYQVRKFFNGEPALQTYQAYNDPVVPPEGVQPSQGSPAANPKDFATEKIVLNAPKVIAQETESVKLTPEKIKQVRIKMKSSLSSAYVAEQAYFAEFEKYSVDFKEMGFYLDLNNQALDFKFGFMDSDSDKFIEANQYSSLSKDIKLQDARKFCKAECTIRNDGFEVMSATNLDNDDDLDVWTINQNKELEHVFDDLAK